jgi:hypothetical protein
LYPSFERWFGIPRPSAKDLAILPDSMLSVNPVRDEARRQEAARRRPHSDLLSMTPAAAAHVERRRMHQLAYEIGERHLKNAREKLASFSASERAQRLATACGRCSRYRAGLPPRGSVSRRAPMAHVEAVSLSWRRALTCRYF